MNPNVDAVIFDFAGVLSTSPAALMLQQLDGFDIDLATFVPIIMGPLHEDSDHPWHELERGRITFDQYVAAIAQEWTERGFDSFPMPPTSDALLAGLRPVPEMIDAVRAVRAAGYHTAILTNNIKEWGVWREVWDADNLVDVVVDSCEVELRKPNPAIFELTLERLGHPAPARTLFVDDFPWNIAAAEALGLQTLQVTDPVAAAAEILEFLL